MDGRSLFDLMERPDARVGPRDPAPERRSAPTACGGYRAHPQLRLPLRHVEAQRASTSSTTCAATPTQLRNRAGTRAYADDRGASSRRRLEALRGCSGAGCMRPPRLRLRSSRCVDAVPGGPRSRAPRLPQVSEVRLPPRAGACSHATGAPPFELAVPGGQALRARARLELRPVVTLDWRSRRPVAGPSTRSR